MASSRPDRSPPSSTASAVADTAALSHDDDARASALLRWYRASGREMPWRHPEGQADPYAVLVSELMLQQTRVDTVIPYFARWMARWPAISDLAQASTDDVLAAWTGLGYYNRARNLHRAAQVVVANHGGILPRDADALAALPGVGPYTQGAVRSIAFSEAAPLVDGNVARVLTRWQALHAPPAETRAKRALWTKAAQLLTVPVANDSPGDWNQSLMELGATVCTARQPRCDACPVNAWCAAHAQGLASQLPVRTAKRKAKKVEATYVLWQRPDGAIWCGQRPATGRWAGLWEPPGAEGAAAIAQLTAQLPADVLVVEQPKLVHILTHRRYEVRALWVRSATSPPALTPLGYTRAKWMSPEVIADKHSGLSRLAARLMERCAAG